MCMLRKCKKAELYYFKQADQKKEKGIFTITAGIWLSANKNSLA